MTVMLIYAPEKFLILYNYKIYYLLDGVFPERAELDFQRTRRLGCHIFTFERDAVLPMNKISDTCRAMTAADGARSWCARASKICR